MNMPAPICFVCHKTVDQISTVEADLDSFDFRFTVWCHGQQETQRIPLRVFRELDRMPVIRRGEAFVPPATSIRDILRRERWSANRKRAFHDAVAVLDQAMTTIIPIRDGVLKSEPWIPGNAWPDGRPIAPDPSHPLDPSNWPPVQSTNADREFSEWLNRMRSLSST